MRAHPQAHRAPASPFTKGGTRGIYFLLCILIFITRPAHADENLIPNAGFEELSGSMPLRWEIFVQPADGATGRLVNEAHTGSYAVQLEVATPYAKDPANNWSQNILGEFGGKRLRLSGYIKVSEVEDAAIWVQCWRKEPFRMLQLASTSTRAPIYGTKDWDETFVEFDVPQNTDYLTVRCVIKGSGTATFDDLSLTVLGDAPRKALPPESSTTPKPDLKMIYDLKSSAEKAPFGFALREETDALLMREQNRMLKDTLDALRTKNEDLLKRIKSLEEQLKKP